LIDEGLERLFREIEMPFIKVLSRMEMNGVLIDEEKLASLCGEGEIKILEVEKEMLSCLGERSETQKTLFGAGKVKSDINFGSPRQITDVIINRLGLPCSETTPKGKPSVGKRTLYQLKGQHPFIDLLLKHRKLKKLVDSYLKSLPKFLDPDGRIRPSFHDTGTVTGRLSSSKPNFQQLPRPSDDPLGVRSLMIAPEGKKLIALDYNQQELRIMAELSHDEKLLSIIQNDGDLHLINANLVFNLGIPEEYLYKGHPKYEETAKNFKKERDKGKVFSFGIPYGMGPNKLSKDFGVDLQEAQTLLDNFFEGFPLLEDAIQETHDQANRENCVSTFVGRSRHFTLNDWGKLDSSSLRQSFNFLIQGFGADLIRMSCTAIQRYADKNPSYGIKLLMTIHDEIVCEVNADVCEEVAERCKVLMEGVYKMDTVPLIVSYGIGNNYDEAK
jgi:DNA polymerase-1